MSWVMMTTKAGSSLTIRLINRQIFLSVALCFVHYSYATSIHDGKLFALPSLGSESHFGSYKPYLNRLVADGHHIHYLDAGKKVIAASANCSSHRVYFERPPDLYGLVRRWRRIFDAQLFVQDYSDADQEFGDFLRHHDSTLDELMSVDWSVAVADGIFSPHAYAIILRLNEERGTPFVLFMTNAELAASTAWQISLGRSPIVKAFMFPKLPKNSDDFHRPTIFRHRLSALVDVLYEVAAFGLYVETWSMPNVAKFGVRDFSWLRLFKDSSFTFSDSLDRIGWPAPEGTDIINIGAHCHEPETLDGELKAFVEDEKSKGTIFMAFGTYAAWNVAPMHIVRAFANGLQHFSDYRIILSYNGDVNKMPKLPFIKLITWAPQTAILSHPKTRVFISHGGLKSLKESICTATPLLFMPLSAEQAYNTHNFLAYRLGRLLNKFTMTEQNVVDEISELLNDPGYKQRIQRTRTLMLDRPIKALDSALFWTNRVLRTRAPSHQVVFKRKGMELYWHEHLYADLALGVVSLVLLLK